MTKYHLRRMDREIKDEYLINLILDIATHINIAMADENEPYIVPINYIYDSEQKNIYFHGAKEGKKIELLQKNPRVWGSAVIDHGFGKGQCENMYASVVFSGNFSFVEDQESQLMILRKQIDKQSGDKEEMKTRLDAMVSKDNPLFASTCFGRIKIDSLTGKRSTLWTEERLKEILS
jgi:nitroimidazol reductase NimA-like FMN-containing flavoprotein (pyridoxamine 5'-phosphate oxidase superfamily)